MRPNPPCKGCENRSTYCHGTCPEYLDYYHKQTAWREEQFQKRKEVEAIEQMRAFRIRSIMKKPK